MEKNIIKTFSWPKYTLHPSATSSCKHVDIKLFAPPGLLAICQPVTRANYRNLGLVCPNMPTKCIVNRCCRHRMILLLSAYHLEASWKWNGCFRESLLPCFPMQSNCETHHLSNSGKKKIKPSINMKQNWGEME